MAKTTTPAQAIRYMAVRAVFTQLLATRQWKVPDLNRAVGWSPHYTPPYVWLSGKGSPNARTVALIEKKLGIKLDLGPSSAALAGEVVPYIGTGGGAGGAGASGGGPVVASAPRKAIITHIIHSDGSASLRFDCVLPAKQSFSILAILNDAGLIPDGE